MGSSRLAATLAATLCCVLPGHPGALAAQLSFEQSSDLSLTYTDNRGLEPGGGDATNGYSVFHAGKFALADEARELAGGFRFGINRYAARPDLDSFDASLSLTGRIRRERDLLALAFSYQREPTQESELATTGVAQPGVQRSSTSIAPSWTHFLTPETSVQLSYSLLLSRYGGGSGGTSLEDYTNQQASAGLEHALSPATTARLSLSAARYETDSGSSRTDSLSVAAGLDSALSERLRLSFQIGQDRNRSERQEGALTCRFNGEPVDPLLCQLGFIPFQQIEVPVSGSGQGLSFAAGLDYALEAGSVSVKASRGQNPSGLGDVLRTDTLAFNYGRRLSEAINCGFAASWVESESGTGTEAGAGRSRYLRIAPSLRWQLTPEFALNFGYTFARAQREGVADATENALAVSGVYSWPLSARPY